MACPIRGMTVSPRVWVSWAAKALLPMPGAPLIEKSRASSVVSRRHLHRLKQPLASVEAFARQLADACLRLDGFEMAVERLDLAGRAVDQGGSSQLLLHSDPPACLVSEVVALPFVDVVIDEKISGDEDGMHGDVGVGVENLESGSPCR